MVKQRQVDTVLACFSNLSFCFVCSACVAHASFSLFPTCLPKYDNPITPNSFFVLHSHKSFLSFSASALSFLFFLTKLHIFYFFIYLQSISHINYKQWYSSSNKTRFCMSTILVIMSCICYISLLLLSHRRFQD